MGGNLDRIRRLVAVEREHATALVAIDLLLSELKADPSFLQPRLEARDAKSLAKNVEATFLIRIFAEFEGGLRVVYREVLGKQKRPNVETLVNRIAVSNAIAGPDLDRVHEVRRYRNSLIHADSEQVDRIELKAARSRLCKYLSRIRGW